MAYLKRVRNIFIRLYGAYFLDKNIRDFITHNQRIWQQSNTCNFGKAEILFEYNKVHGSIISFSYLACILQKKFNAKVIVYSINRVSRQPLGVYLLRCIVNALIPEPEKKIYSSFGAKSFISVDPSKQQIETATQLFNNVYPSLRNKRDLENLTVNDVWIGDLIYDNYLRKYSVPTIDIKDNKFTLFLQERLESFVFWQEYFDAHNVKAVNVSHCGYSNGIPLRIAIQKEIPAYQTNTAYVYRLSRKNMFAYGDYKYFPDIFSKLSPLDQSAGIKEAQKRIDARFSGVVGVDMSYSTKSAYGEKRSQPVLRKSNKLKVLIAAHCFFDSPHSYGNNLFPDFYDWLDYVGKISNETDYDWYIKTHPDYLPGNMEVIEYFLCKYPKLTLVDASASHHQLIEEGISCALTTYGTIGFEYASLGVLVVNASDCNPHIAYDFNLHPKTVEEYGNILMHLDVQTIKINKEEVCEYYYMKFIQSDLDWLIQDYLGMIEQLGGYGGESYTPVYGYFLGKFSEERHLKVLATLTKFVESGDFRLNRSHMVEDYQMMEKIKYSKL